MSTLGAFTNLLQLANVLVKYKFLQELKSGIVINSIQFSNVLVKFITFLISKFGTSDKE